MDQHLCLFVCGDVMMGRGIDRILPHPGDPRLYEPYVHDARDYLRLAEAAHGPIRRPVAEDYVWGEARTELAAADARIINLETSVTTSGDYWPGKEVHYRMNPRNIGCLTAAGIDCGALANNHVLDWGYEIPEAQIHFAHHRSRKASIWCMATLLTTSRLWRSTEDGRSFTAVAIS